MKRLTKTLKASVAAAFLLTNVSSSTQGDVSNGGSSFGPPGTDLIRIRGAVVCTGCALDEIRKLYPSESTFYKLSQRRGRLLSRWNWTSNTVRWYRMGWPPQLWVRGYEHLLQQLTAEANLLTEMEIEGVLSNTRTLDVTGITLSG